MAEPADPRDGSDAQPLPEAVAVPRSRWRMQAVWLVPLVAVLIGGWLVVKAVLEKGPTITISFASGEGLEAGKTKVKFKNVDIGVINTVDLSPDYKSVVATAELAKSASNLLVKDTRFWVVSPRITGGTVTGLGTLLSGSYIGMDRGSQTEKRRDFVGLDTPPVFASDVPGREFILKSETMGSLDVGAPVFFRRLQVGQVTAYDLDPGGQAVTVRVFINAPYDQYVTPDTRFWQASGIDVSLDSSGLSIDTESILSILIGGVAFQTPPDAVARTMADAGTEFALFDSRAEAMKHVDRIADTYVFVFNESVRGLTVGAPVDFRGIVIGEVTAIHTRYDPGRMAFTIPVEVRIYPERFTSRFDSGARGGRLSQDPRGLSRTLVANGLRAQLKMGNLLTGQLYVAMDFFPDAPKVEVDWNRNPPELPTVPGGLESLQESLTGLAEKLNKVPFEGIGNDLRQTLQEAAAVMTVLRRSVAPEARAALLAARSAMESANKTLQPAAGLAQSANDAMREVARTAAAFRALADYLERHPEALLRGKVDYKR
ncbi:PqiB family protein [Bordetella genomosp. 13]|uniref:Mammalian cell entry protein n=1 Tax=Bordetella genomosp. 13 TaxID=463040 RepID=A0A1W6Z8W6_9BORD|nr:MlaD family protein [Bordetella genomosp. 13]ARP93813.1 mammalian cell entry protein [Bordetella genomosp. 13]